MSKGPAAGHIDAGHNDAAGHIDNVMRENRKFPPPAEFAKRARIGSLEEYQRLYARARDHRDEFWREQAYAELHWFRPFDTVFSRHGDTVSWFEGGQTNLSYNCLDAHLMKGLGERTALIWEGEPGETRQLSYAELHHQVCRFANVLKSLGIGVGDVVSIYMPMTPELVIAMLACVRVGAIHSVIFAGFSAEALADRNQDARAKLQITADGLWRRGKVLPLKETVDVALHKSPTVQHCVVLRRMGGDCPMVPGRDHWWHELMDRASSDCPATPLDSETTSFILYTSGSTGKPKGIRHTTAGYNLWVKKTFQWVFDWREEDIFWCTADCGWITGHSYIVYGPLSNGATVLIYEGAPNFPAEDRFWDIIERHRPTILYTAPTAIRAFIKWGDQHVLKHDLSSLRLLGTVGEGINPEAWMWYHRLIGGERCPIVDTWWQTETGGIMMSPLPGCTPTKPGSCTLPLPGIVPSIVDESLQEVERNQGGMLCIAEPWPGMLRGIWGDDRRFVEQYWSKVPGKYLTGDNARIDDDGYYWIMGRIDDVINVAGHRLSTIEIESALVSHPDVAEAAAVGKPDEIKGQGIAVFVTIRSSEPAPGLREALKLHVRKEIGALAVPDEIRITHALPKTRSGKIMRRLLRDIASGKTEISQDTSTLEDYSILAKLRGDEE
ncbi:MAG: acetate--CoA ligase [Planctomycetota bacterium]